MSARLTSQDLSSSHSLFKSRKTLELFGHAFGTPGGFESGGSKGSDNTSRCFTITFLELRFEEGDDGLGNVARSVFPDLGIIGFDKSCTSFLLFTGFLGRFATFESLVRWCFVGPVRTGGTLCLLYPDTLAKLLGPVSSTTPTTTSLLRQRRNKAAHNLGPGLQLA